MIELYVRLVKEGKRDINEVPELFRKEVQDRFNT